ncbi:MAG: SlyX protein [Verrucomicrobiales bacterium]|nr:SlyX protein [Verrucomicrobiales bacterium]
MSNDERLVNIESDLTHLEQLVESLNQTIIEQDKVIQQLQVQINRLIAGVESKEMDAIKSNVTKPPHYQ